jgi:signal transduction histidine kinase
MITDNWLLNWALLTISLFNTIALLWLGITILLNAERRSWGLWLAAGELLLGGAFFLSHTIILGYGFETFSRGLDFWWQLGWIPVVTIPYVWYVVMLWYAGFWEPWSARLNRRHYPWFVITTLLALGVVILLVFANPLPSFVQIARLNLSATPALAGIPLLVLVYPVYILLCIVLSLDVLRRPAPSGRVMGDLARRRARPWLIGATITQIVVSLLVGLAMFWVISSAQNFIRNFRLDFTIATFDLVIAFLIAIAIVFLGQAVISYEVFTGKTLPRRGLKRYWQRAAIVAAGYAALLGCALALELHPIYSALLSAVLITSFYALLSWRSFGERQQEIERLRPVIAGQQISGQILAKTPAEVDVSAPFESLCRDVLIARAAALIPRGPLAALVGEALVYPAGFAEKLPDLDRIPAPPKVLCWPLAGVSTEIWEWLVPLWSERGPSGILCLGPKTDGSLYAQEEMEIARSICERLIDTLASAEMARRLIALQRQRLAESQVIDRRARRVLHDEVLPQLHAVLLALRSDQPVSTETIDLLAASHHQIADLLRAGQAVTATEVSRRGLIGALRRTVTDEFASAFDQVRWELPPGVDAGLALLSPVTAEVVYYAAREAIRNAARHGRVGERPLSLRVAVTKSEDHWLLIIEDNGGGFEPIALPESSGSGLSLHTTMMMVVGGALTIESVQNEFSRVVLQIPGETLPV